MLTSMNRAAQKESQKIGDFLREVGWYLDAGEPNPLAYSHARLFRKPEYCLYAEIVGSQRAPHIRYTIGKLDSAARYDSDVVYSSSSFEDICDVWESFK